MLHNHRDFDRELNPDAAQALEHAIEPVRALLAERLKPQPKNVDDLRAWRDRIAEFESDIARIADRAGVEPASLQAEAERAIRRAGAAPAPVLSAGKVKRVSPTATFGDLAVENETLSRELAELRRQEAAITRQIAARTKRQAAVHKRLFRRGRKLG